MVQIDNRTPIGIRTLKINRWSALDRDRSSWWAHWQDINGFLLPRAGRYFESDKNRSGKHLYNRILDSTGTRALKTARSGIATGVSSPARVWFKLRAPDPEMNNFHPVRSWLEDVGERMMEVFAASNTYRVLDRMYGDLLAYGTSVSLFAADFENVIHLYHSPVGEFYLQQDNRERVNTCYRKFQWTIGELVGEFGFDKVSNSSQNRYRNGDLEATVNLLHAIEPRRDRNPSMLDNLNMPWESTYIEMGHNDPKAGILRQSGFERFPVLAPRAEVNSGDVYGHSQGMEVLGDLKQLQHEQLRKGQVIDHKTDPALQIPDELKELEIETFPGGRTYYNQATPHGGVRPLYQVDLDGRELIEDIFDVRHRILDGFMNQLFLMISSQPASGRDITATEIAARKEEQLIQLGPLLSRMRNELHEPLIDMTFDRMLDVGMIPPPPPELEGQDLEVEFVGMLDQAQQMIGMGNIDRYVGNVVTLAEAVPELVDKVDWDSYADLTGEKLGVPAEMIRPTDEATQLRQARNAAIAAQEQAETLKTQSEALRNASQAGGVGGAAAAPVNGSPAAIADTLGG
jgi:hypothetical protein